MEDDFDYGAKSASPDVPELSGPPPAEPPSFTETALQPVPPLVPRWTAADEIDYARAAGGFADVKRDLAEGNVHPQYGVPVLNEFQASLNSMDQQKQAAQAFQQQTATQTALHGAAVQQAVQIQNQQHAAAAFPTTMYTHLDADGNLIDFYQRRPGQWEEIEPRQTAADDASGERLAAPEEPVAGEADRPLDQAPPAAAEPAAPFTQTIYNGPNRTDTTWQPGQTNGVSSGSWMGRPGGQPARAEPSRGKYDPSPDEMSAFRLIAQQATAGIQNPLHRQDQFAKIMASQIAKSTAGKIADARQEAVNARQQKGLDAKANAQVQGEKRSTWDTMYKEELGGLQKEWDRVRDNKAGDKGTTGATPAWAADRESMEREAEDRADRRFLRSHSELPEVRKGVVAGRDRDKQEQVQTQQQSRQFQDLVAKVSSQQAPVSPAAAAGPSTVDYQRASQLADVTAQHFNDNRGPLGVKAMFNDDTYWAGKLNDITQPANQEQRPMTVDEVRRYERVRAKIKSQDLRNRLKP